jgi:uncharacterized membrane protein YqgA involved in biofilm formation
MTGTLINMGAVLAGGLLGLLLGARLPQRIRDTVVAGLGLFTLAFGFQMFLKTTNPLIVLGGVLLGAVVGEWLRLEDGLRRIGSWLESRFVPAGTAPGGAQGRFVRGFLTASIVFCVGPMTILGSVQDFQVLAVKSVLDGFAALAFASSLGVGVLFSIPVILIYQGGITLLASQINTLVTETMMAEMSAAGGVILLGIAISSLLEIRPLRPANFLPALFFAPLIAAMFGG